VVARTCDSKAESVTTGMKEEKSAAELEDLKGRKGG
jgi:hypothetical protein